MYGQTEASSRISCFNIMSNLKKIQRRQTFKQTKNRIERNKKIKRF